MVKKIVKIFGNRKYMVAYYRFTEPLPKLLRARNGISRRLDSEGLTTWVFALNLGRRVFALKIEHAIREQR